MYIYIYAITYFPIQYFGFPTNQNWVLAEAADRDQKVKITNFVKRARPQKCSSRNFVFMRILRYVHYFDWQNMEISASDSGVFVHLLNEG